MKDVYTWQAMRSLALSAVDIHRSPALEASRVLRHVAVWDSFAENFRASRQVRGALKVASEVGWMHKLFDDVALSVSGRAAGGGAFSDLRALGIQRSLVELVETSSALKTTAQLARLCAPMSALFCGYSPDEPLGVLGAVDSSGGALIWGRPRAEPSVGILVARAESHAPASSKIAVRAELRCELCGTELPVGSRDLAWESPTDLVFSFRVVPLCTCVEEFSSQELLDALGAIGRPKLVVVPGDGEGDGRATGVLRAIETKHDS